MNENMISFESKSEDDTKKLAERAGKIIREGVALALIGDLGAGKTFFAKYLAKALGVKEEVTSPTFNLMNIYEGVCPMYHFDLYRLESVEQLEDIGFYEYIESEEGISLIEWADKFIKELSENTVKVTFEKIDENSRKISFSGKGKLAEEFLEKMKEGSRL